MAAAAAEMLIPLKRIGTPVEAAGAMLLLASPYASFISGQVSTVCEHLHHFQREDSITLMLCMSTRSKMVKLGNLPLFLGKAALLCQQFAVF